MEPVEALKRGDEAISWLVDAISHISSFRGDASVYTWLYAILLRRCRRMRRSLSVKIDQLSSDDVEPVLFRSGNYGRLPPVEGRMQVREAISALDHKYREAIVLFYYEEFSIKEMAQLLGVPEGTVKNRLHRAREKLRLLLESEEEICL
jgi:RNA polymerase sigma-70 factor (ECF subfamily)